MMVTASSSTRFQGKDFIVDEFLSFLVDKLMSF